MKFIVVLFISVLFTIFIGTLAKNLLKSNNNSLISPLVADTINNTGKQSLLGTQVFVNNYFNYKIKHPSDVNIKNMTNGDVSLQKDKSINISITQQTLAGNNTINTEIEKNIDQKKNRLKDQFNLINNISPIAIDSSTAQTYTSEEKGVIYTYYYVPQNNNKYLIISNSSPNNGSRDYLISEEIIYSLDLLP